MQRLKKKQGISIYRKHKNTICHDQKASQNYGIKFHPVEGGMGTIFGASDKILNVM